MKHLADLWPDINAAYAAISISAVTLDSREVKQGALFIALKGLHRDARDFIADVIAAGAVAVFAEQDEKWPQETVVNGVPVITIPHLAGQAGMIASRFFDEPSQRMKVLAVTGTNGKTSVANLLAAALTRLNHSSAVLGTLGNGRAGQLEKSTHTTLDACHLQALLSKFADEGAQYIAMEASSHGLVQGRLNGTAIDVAIFTNLTRDHLDYHGTMENYATAKEILFRWPGLKAAVLNADDPAAARYRAVIAPQVRVISYSQRADSHADVRALQVRPTLSGLQIQLSTPVGDAILSVGLLGRFNVSNILAVVAGLLALDISLTDIVQSLNFTTPVPSRMESFSGAHPTVVVDYAHTPDALEKVLASLREHAEANLICVFGCGGDRDSGKRPLMGQIASRLADRVIVTNDNPRSENPESIVSDILAGASAGVTVTMDRRHAIRDAIASAGRRDIVLIAGKGHEDYQEIAGVRHPFSDAQEVRAALALWRAT